jgi:SAM-dependent MidA family methyltransferase
MTDPRPHPDQGVEPPAPESPPVGHPVGGRSTLAARLRGRIREQGAITFAGFMEAALYDPEEGFYTRPSVGEGGHFVTSPHVSRVFGELLGRQVEQMWEALGRPEPFSIVEAGAGDGTLAAQILVSLSTELREVARYVAVERSSGARDLLGGLAPEVTVCSSFDEVPRGVDGCVLANEVLDNIPFHRLRRVATGLVELRVGLKEGLPAGEDDDDIAFSLVEGPVSDERLTRMAPSLFPGEEATVSPGALDFVDQAASAVRRGFVLLIDYGFERSDQTTSVHAYLAHRVEADVLSYPGSRDITAGVNFQALAEHGRARGLAVWGPVSQKAFLDALGHRTWDADARALQVEALAHGRGIDAIRIYSERARAGLLVEPTGLGGFLVLCLGVGVGPEAAPDWLEGMVAKG